jgi:hypothetical protein
MASITFLLQSKNAPANIYVQLSLGRGKVFKRKSGFSIDPKDWSKNNYPIDRDEDLKNLKSNLSTLSSHLTKELNYSTAHKIDPDGEWLQLKINEFNGIISTTLRDHLTNHIQYIVDNAHRIKKANNQIGLSHSRVKSYKLFKNTVIRFQDENTKGKPVLIKDVGFQFGEQFADWLFSKNYSTNYVGKNIDNLKAVCRDADKRGINTSDNLNKITSFSKPIDNTEVIILSDSEQSRIEKLELSNDALINARKWLLLGCQIGQRFGDLIRVTQDMVKATNGIKVIEIRQQKTGKLVAIPLMPKAIEIIENEMPYPIASQNFNQHIKTLCKLAELNEPTKGSKYIKEDGKKNKYRVKTPGVYPKWQLIGSHICRRSFASNFYTKIPTPILISITGHSTEKMFLRYIGRTSLDNAHQMMEYFGRLQAKEKKEIQLQVLRNAN